MNPMPERSERERRSASGVVPSTDAVELEHVSFSFDDHVVLRDISFRAVLAFDSDRHVRLRLPRLTDSERN